MLKGGSPMVALVANLGDNLSESPSGPARLKKE